MRNRAFRVFLPGLLFTLLAISASIRWGTPARAGRIKVPSFEFQVLDYPAPALANFPLGITERGDVGGFYVDVMGGLHGYLYSRGRFSPLDYPGSTGSGVASVLENGTINGLFFDENGFQHGFVRDKKGQFTRFDVPFAAQTRGIRFEIGEGLGTAAFGMNNHRDMVGEFADANGVGHGWLWRQGKYTVIDHPAAAVGSGLGTNAIGINNKGEVSGKYFSAAPPFTHGYLWKKGEFTNIDHPDAGGFFGTQANGINEHGDIVGAYSDAGDGFHGFLYEDGVYHTIDFPGPAAIASELHVINDHGDITGSYFDANFVAHGFIAWRKKGHD